jgi:hypothetical protein
MPNALLLVTALALLACSAKDSRAKTIDAGASESKPDTSTTDAASAKASALEHPTDLARPPRDGHLPDELRPPH